jgi:hypothetical protein
MTSYSRVFEMFIYNRLLGNFNNEIILFEKFGFRKKLTTEKSKRFLVPLGSVPLPVLGEMIILHIINK